jgi:hypothetical protein
MTWLGQPVAWRKWALNQGRQTLQVISVSENADRHLRKPPGGVNTDDTLTHRWQSRHKSKFTMAHWNTDDFDSKFEWIWHIQFFERQPDSQLKFQCHIQFQSLNWSDWQTNFSRIDDLRTIITISSNIKTWYNCLVIFTYLVTHQNLLVTEPSSETDKRTDSMSLTAYFLTVCICNLNCHFESQTASALRDLYQFSRHTFNFPNSVYYLHNNCFLRNLSAP